MNERTFKASDAHKLEDPARLEWLPPEEIVRALQLDAGLMVADIGAGTGYFSIPFARAIGPAGRVFAVDLQSEMLDILRSKLAPSDILGTIELIEGAATATHLQDASCDLAFLANIWHELDDLPGVLRELARILRPDGRLAILDWRADVAGPPGPPADHRIGADQTVKTLESGGWTIRQSENAGRYGYLVVAGRSHR